MKNLSVLIIFLSICFTGMAQEDKAAREQLDNLSKTLLKSTGTKAEFTITINDTKSGQKETMQGSILFKQDKFKLITDDIEAYYDGKKQWIYMDQSDEVTVSEPTDEDLQFLNPTAIISSYKQGYKLKKEQDKTVNGKQAYVINIYPENREMNFHRIEIVAEKATHNLLSISTFDKNGLETTIKITKFLTNQNFSDNMFVFDKKQYPNAEIIEIE